MTREEVINKLYRRCVETMDIPPEWSDVKCNLFFVAMITAGQVMTNGKIASVRNSGDEPTMEDAFGALTEEVAKDLSRSEHYTPALLRDVRNATKIFLKSWDWDKEEPREILTAAGAEISKELRAKREPPTYTPTRAKRLTRTNTLLSNNLHDLINKGEQTLYTGRLKSENPLKEVVEITMIDSAGVTIEGNFTSFLEMVFCAYLSLYLAGNDFITPQMIRRFLTQDYEDKNTKGAKVLLQKIEQAIECLWSMFVTVDATDEIERGMKNIDKRFYRGHVLDLREDICIINGHAMKGTRLLAIPLLYEHAMERNQLQSFPLEVYAVKAINPETGKPFSTTETRIGVKGYLLAQISNMKSDNERARSELRTYNSKRAKNPEGYPRKTIDSFRKYNSKMLYSTIFERSGLEGKSRSTLIDCESYIKACLKSWTAAGYIKGYKPLHEGARKDVETGVKIYLE